MKKIKGFVTKHPILFVLFFPIVWFLFITVFAGISSTLFHIYFDDGLPISIGKIIVTIVLLLMIWKMNWIRATGIVSLGSWHVWLVTLVALVYFSCASLYSFYNQISFDVTTFFESPMSRSMILLHFIAGLSEEILYRGIVLYSLIRVWGNSSRGLMSSAALTSLLFAVIHLTLIFTHGLSSASSLLLFLETIIIGFWWAALVLKWGSIWPAVVTHFITNLIVGVQGLSTSIIEPIIFAYISITLFSLPLGIIGVWLILKLPHRSIIPNVP
jgi:membrane protease YdiL (CAAX protease family)